MIRKTFLVFCFLLDLSQVNLQYRPGQASYNLLNLATSRLTEALTGSSDLFGFGQRNQENTSEKPTFVQQQNNYQQPNNYQQSQNTYQPSVNYQQQQSSQQSCSSFFAYQNDRNENYAVVTIPNPDYVKNVLKVHLSLGARLTSQNYGSLNLLKSTQDSTNDVSLGNSLSYIVRFPVQNPLPKPTMIYNNDQLLCSGPPERASYVTDIILDHTFTTGLTGSNQQRPQPQVNYRPQVTQQQTAPPRIVYMTAPPPQNQNPNLINGNRFVESDFECGVPNFKSPSSSGLIIKGQTAVRGQFPWLAAYYHNGVGDNGFICGGSLISTKIIVTAAHCLRNKNEAITRKADEATFYIGKYNLESLSSEQNYVLSAVTQFFVHPQWNSNDERFDADIAIAVLTRTIPFSKFVKPVCLWTSTTNTNDLVGKTAIVAGWGKTETSAVASPTPKWTEIQVVNLFNCIQSNYKFNSLTSERTFCAGNRVDGTGPCNGDSGGGLVAKTDNKWYLRGVVSSSLIDPVLSTCDTKNYAVYTDVSKFTGWIQGFIQTYG